MPLIKPRTKKVTFVRHAYRLSSTMRDVLVQYAKFIDESPDYVLNAVLEATLAKDCDFLAWQGTAPLEATDVPQVGATAAPLPRREPASR